MARPSPQTERLVEIIELMAEAPGRGFQLTELANRIGTDKATCFPMLSELTRVGWLVKDRDKRTYRLGPRLVALGAAAATAQTVAEAAVPVMADLSDELRAMVCLILPSSDDLVVADVVRPSEGGIGLPALHAGDRIEFRPPLGSVLVAWSGPHAADVWIGRDATLSDARDDYRRTLQAICRRGFAVELLPFPARDLDRMTMDTIGQSLGSHRARQLASNQGSVLSSDLLVAEIDSAGSYEPLAISAACFDASGTAVAALSVVPLRAPLSGTALEALGQRVTSAASAITRFLGGVPPGS